MINRQQNQCFDIMWCENWMFFIDSTFDGYLFYLFSNIYINNALILYLCAFIVRILCEYNEEWKLLYKPRAFSIFYREYNAIWCFAKPKSLRICGHHSFSPPNKPIWYEWFRNWIFENWMSRSVTVGQCCVLDWAVLKSHFS